MRNNLLYCSLSLIGVSERTLNKIKLPRSRAKSANEASLPEGLCRQFSLKEIRASTFNFDSKFVIGRGGSGDVYKGVMDNGTLVVAVKRLKPRTSSRAREKLGLEEFRNEVKLLCQLRHQHLIYLIGFCHEKDEKILVYNYMSNGSLYDRLHNSIGYDPLSWKQRLEICIGPARGLHYLRTGAKRAIIHRDIKTNNILMDGQLVPKLSDFGLSEIGPSIVPNAPLKLVDDHKWEYHLIRESIESLSTTVVGTFGYLDPEYFLTGVLNLKSDVYSFGVVLFEVLCCCRPVVKADVEKDRVHLVEWVIRCIKDGTIYDTIDPFLRGKVSPGSLEKFMEIACHCVHVSGKKRPAMGEVEATLELALEMQIQADSEMEHIHPNGECMYEEVFSPLLPFNVSDVHSFKT
ncbi:hypothetical protein COLO4_03901 [Corchorus olitorius]|uniref:Protein kinase domain-containing protein n=1 Tax=Corchorus olitorius TaxID=93759 RepID=A0A1R3KW30_9ROSI|nr:hypothetical protein COLO4_03901 [Corchorus olitorius]